MVSRDAPLKPRKPESQDAVPVIERSSDPVQLLVNILEVAGEIAAQWGEEIVMHLRVAALWVRIGKRLRALFYLQHLASLHVVDDYHLGAQATRIIIDMMRLFFTKVGEDPENLFAREEDRKRVQRQMMVGEFINRFKFAKTVSKHLGIMGYAYGTLTPEEEELVDDIIRPRVTWIENVFLTPIAGDTRYVLVQELNAIKEYDSPDAIAAKLLKLFSNCRGWHERKSDTPIWVHDLDDVGPRSMYLAVMAERPGVIVTYIERCIDALNERPLALMMNVATAIGGLAYFAKKHQRDDLLTRALDFLPRLPEHERCISALSLVEVLVER